MSTYYALRVKKYVVSSIKRQVKQAEGEGRKVALLDESKRMKTGTRRFVKLTIGTELRTQPVAAIKVRRGMVNENRDFEPVVGWAHRIKPVGWA